MLHYHYYRHHKSAVLLVVGIVFAVFCVGNVSAIVSHIHDKAPRISTTISSLLPPSDPSIHYLGRTLLVPKTSEDTEHVAYDFSMVTISVGVNVVGDISNTIQNHTSSSSSSRGSSGSTTISGRFRFPCMAATGEEEPSRRGNRIQININGSPLLSNPVIDTGIPTIQGRCNTVISMPLFTTTTPTAQEEDMMSKTHGVVTLSLVKISEPDYNNRDLPPGMDNSIRFYGFEVSSSSSSSAPPPLPPTKVFVRPVRSSSLSSHRFQIIGDSITAGYQIMCPPKNRSMSSNYALENVTATYSGQTCALLGAECHVEAWSGRGAVRNIEGDLGATMAVIDTRILGALKCPKLTSSSTATTTTCRNTWLYPTSWIPTAIFYNLGTNDFSHDVAPTNYTEGVVGMILAITSKYAPTHMPPVVLQCGPMSYRYCPDLSRAQSELKSLISNPVFLYEHPHILNSTNDCSGHPDVNVSRTLAQIFTAYLRQEVLPTS